MVLYNLLFQHYNDSKVSITHIKPKDEVEEVAKEDEKRLKRETDK